MDDSTIQNAFLSAFSQLMENREEIIENLRMMQAALCDHTALDEQCAALEIEMDQTAELAKQCLRQDLLGVNQTQYDRYAERYDALQQQYEKLQAKRKERITKEAAIGGFLFEILELEKLPIEFDEKLWNATIDHVTVYGDDRLVFTFQCGAEIENNI